MRFKQYIVLFALVMISEVCSSTYSSVVVRPGEGFGSGFGGASETTPLPFSGEPVIRPGPAFGVKDAITIGPAGYTDLKPEPGSKTIFRMTFKSDNGGEIVAFVSQKRDGSNVQKIVYNPPNAARAQDIYARNISSFSEADQAKIFVLCEVIIALMQAELLERGVYELIIENASRISSVIGSGIIDTTAQIKPEWKPFIDAALKDHQMIFWAEREGGTAIEKTFVLPLKNPRITKEIESTVNNSLSSSPDGIHNFDKIQKIVNFYASLSELMGDQENIKLLTEDMEKLSLKIEGRASSRRGTGGRPEGEVLELSKELGKRGSISSRLLNALARLTPFRR